MLPPVYWASASLWSYARMATPLPRDFKEAKNQNTWHASNKSKLIVANEGKKWSQWTIVWSIIPCNASTFHPRIMKHSAQNAVQNQLHTDCTFLVLARERKACTICWLYGVRYLLQMLQYDARCNGTIRVCACVYNLQHDSLLWFYIRTPNADARNHFKHISWCKWMTRLCDFMSRIFFTSE